jgi:hypothetical protein
MNSGTAEQEQNGVTTPIPGARMLPKMLRRPPEMSPNCFWLQPRLKCPYRETDPQKEGEDFRHVIEEEMQALAEMRVQGDSKNIGYEPLRHPIEECERIRYQSTSNQTLRIQTGACSTPRQP